MTKYYNLYIIVTCFGVETGGEIVSVTRFAANDIAATAECDDYIQRAAVDEINEMLGSSEMKYCYFEDLVGLCQ